MEVRVEGRRRRVILVAEEERKGWVVRLLRIWVPSSPAPRTRIEDGGGGGIVGLMVGGGVEVCRLDGLLTNCYCVGGLTEPKTTFQWID